jgi:hypothetical protein
MVAFGIVEAEACGARATQLGREGVACGPVPFGVVVAYRKTDALGTEPGADIQTTSEAVDEYCQVKSGRQADERALSIRGYRTQNKCTALPWGPTHTHTEPRDHACTPADLFA